jgi:serine protease Do
MSSHFLVKKNHFFVSVRYRMLFALFASYAAVSPGLAQETTIPPVNETERRLEQQRTLNEALEQRIKNLEAELSSDICSAIQEQGSKTCMDPSPLIDFSRPTVSPGSTPETKSELSPATPNAKAEEQASTPKPETSASIEATASESAQQLGNIQSVEKLENVTAYILTKMGTSGTGFFVGDGLLMTNQHVIDGVQVGEKEAILITSHTLGRPYMATVIATTPKAEPGAVDFALLRVDALTGNPTIKIARNVQKLDTVLAAGYPGLVVSNDKNLMDFMQGNANASPDLVLSSGEVSALQQSSLGTPIIVHTASISSGNSGGPLMDRCGRIVGINTFITADQETASRAGFALSSVGILNFSKQSGATLMVDDRPCIAK